MSDRDLVADARAGHEEAYAELYRRYERRIGAYVHRMVGDFGRAEDVKQEAFLSALRRLRATDSDIAFKPWIYEIARNASIDLHRRRSRAEEISIEADESLRRSDRSRLVGGAAPEAALTDKEDLRRLMGALDELATSQHRVLVLRELEGLSYREISQRTGLTRPAVESSLFRARRNLAHEYSELESGRRCAIMSNAIGRVAEGGVSIRERRRLARHLRHCTSCRRHARELGVDRELERRSLRSRVAALLPLPWLVGGEARASLWGPGPRVRQSFGGWASSAGQGVDASSPLWGKAATIVAAIALVTAGGVAQLGGSGSTDVAQAGEAEGGAAAGGRAELIEGLRGAGPGVFPPAAGGLAAVSPARPARRSPRPGAGRDGSSETSLEGTGTGAPQPATSDVVEVVGVDAPATDATGLDTRTVSQAAETVIGVAGGADSVAIEPPAVEPKIGVPGIGEVKLPAVPLVRVGGRD